MTESTRGGVGSVAEETARLLDALMAGPARERAADTTPARCGACGRGAGDDGCDPPGPEPVCRLCPVCQLLRVARSVRPETVDRLADLAAALSDMMREVAATRRAETARHRPTAEGAPVQDVRGHEDDPTGPDDAAKGRDPGADPGPGAGDAGARP